MAISEYTDISGVQMLLKHTAGVFSDSGTTAAVDGSFIQQWNDQSGNSNHATQTGANTAKPIYSTSSLNSGRVVFDFWRSGSTPTPILTLPGSLDRRSFSLLYVIKPQTVDRAQYVFNSTSLTLILNIQNRVLNVFNSSNRVSSLKIQSGQPNAIVIVGDATSCRVYLNDSASLSTLSVLSAGTSTGLQIGDSSAKCVSEILEVCRWNVTLTPTQITDVLALAVSRNGVQTSPVANVVFDGDSITEGNGATRNRNWPVRLGASPTVGQYNHAITGQTIANANADVVSEIDSYSFKSTGYLLLFLGTNDIAGSRTAAQIQTDLQAYCDARVTAGWTRSKIGVCTIGIRSSSVATDVNTWLRANYTTFAGKLIDVGADANIGTGSSGSATYWVDGAHYTDAGYQILADLFLAQFPELKPPVAGAASEVSHSHNTAVISWTAGTYGIGTINAQLQVNPNGAGWSNVSGVTSSPGTASGLTPSTAYQFRVAYTDSYQTVYSNTVSLTTDVNPDTTAPVISSASISSDGQSLIVNYTEAGNPPIQPSSGATGVSLVSSTAVSITVSNGTRTGSVQHTFPLSRTIYDNETITLSYDRTTGNILDGASPQNELPNQSGTAVTNSSTVTPSISSVSTDAIALVGTASTITWSSAGIIGTVDILLSLDNGSTFPITIVSGTTNDGSHSWVPEAAQLTDQGVIRVRSSSNNSYQSTRNVKVATTEVLGIGDINLLTSVSGSVTIQTHVSGTIDLSHALRGRIETNP